MSIADLRKSYERARLSEDELDGDPFRQFDRWFQAAVPLAAEANAMTLATVGADGRPATRIVLLKGYESDAPHDGASGRGLVWFTNYESRKGVELAIHPYAALQFFWPELERQIRIEGLVERVTVAESDAYFLRRPRESQIGAWASPQSRPVADRAALEEAERLYALRFPEAVPRPPHWGGYRLVPDRFEFWQGRPSRLHDRFAYTEAAAGAWRIERLAP